ncbi:MAG: A/G-specific adenine glycosylase [Pseudomonadota bacterium]
MTAVAQRHQVGRKSGAQSRQRLAKPASIAPKLLAWYDRERRDLPWRAKPGEPTDPYAVWLSEVMLQQTTAKAVGPYYQRFLEIWPTVDALAAADEEHILTAWAGLGYYSRARNLHRCAKVIVSDFGGCFPQTEAELLKLPGIGPYTAAAVAAIAFDAVASPVDGNIERVTARLFRIETPLPSAKTELRSAAATLTPATRTGDFAQAMMDLGATVCTPKRPSCLVCPLQEDCHGYRHGVAASLPRRGAKIDRPVRRGTAFVAIGEDGRILLRQRPETGLLARMIEVPSTEWLDGVGDSRGDALQVAPIKADWWRVPDIVTHTFTHFRLELGVYRAVVARNAPLTIWADGSRCRWVHRRDLEQQALPSVMKKVVAHALKGL